MPAARSGWASDAGSRSGIAGRGASSVPWASAAGTAAGAGAAGFDDDDELEDVGRVEEPRLRRDPGLTQREQRAAGRAGQPISRASRDRDNESIAPSWEAQRRHEAYPAIRDRGPRIPRAAILAGALIICAVAVFFLVPPLLFGSGTTSPKASPTPSASVIASGSPTAAPSVAPSVASTTYTVKGGDTLSKIAKAFGVTVDQIALANPQIKDINKLNIGDVLNIPTASASTPATAAP